MGLQIGDIVPRKAVEFSDLKNKIVAIDAFNVIYQFLSSIRQPDGTPLMDSKRRVTSHLSGLFYRNIKLLQEGLKLVYVFDGEPPELKSRTHEKRKETKSLAREKYEDAKQREDVESMGKYSRQMSTINQEMLDESKKLLESLGICVVQAPGEGEAQAAYLARNYKEIYAVGSQDYDSLLFGAPRLIQNLTLASKRKTVSGWMYISPEIIELEKVLNHLQLNQEQLISLGILSGTDYNPGGIKGIGQKKALKFVRNFKSPAVIFRKAEESLGLDFDWQEIFQLFKNPNIESSPDLSCPSMDEEKIRRILVDEHEFSESRISVGLEKLYKAKDKAKQRTLF
jgi:flap endonuclease-1